MRPVFAYYGFTPVSLDDFTCGVPELDDFLRRDAARFVEQGLSAVKLLIDEDCKKAIGFYAISPATVQIKWLSAAQQNHFHVSFPIPAWLIGRLAVDRAYQRRHFGEILLCDAVLNIQKRAHQGAGALIIVDAKDATVKHFYEKYGFTALYTQRNLKLARPIAEVEN